MFKINKILRFTALAILTGLVATPFFQPSLAYAADNLPPVISLTGPSGNISGTVTYNATASDKYSNCIVTLFGKQYDVSPLRGDHPGGNIFTCGTDMTSVYQGEHGTSVSRMQPYLIPSTYVGVTKVEFYVDGVLKFTDTNSPYSYSFNSATVPNGAHVILAKASDGANTANSSQISVVVNNVGTTPPPANNPPTANPNVDNIAPVVSVISPVNNSSASGTVNISVSASDNKGVTKVELYVDGSMKATDIAAPFTFIWNFSGLNGIHNIQAKAYDAAGNMGASSLVNLSLGIFSSPASSRHHDDDDDDDHDNDDDEREEKIYELKKKIIEKTREAEKKQKESLRRVGKEATKKQKERAKLIGMIEALKQRLASLEN